MIEVTMNRLMRRVVEQAAILAPIETRRRICRHARGREEIGRLRQADYAIVSHGKSGRTWLIVMLSRFLQLRYGLPEQDLISFDNLHNKQPEIPTVLITHDHFLRDYTGDGGGKRVFYEKPTLLLVRHPGDVAVSQFFQWRHRMTPHKQMLNDYPKQDADVSIFDFLMSRGTQLERTISFMNEWAKELPRLRNGLMVRYEDMRTNPQAELHRILTWFGFNPTDEEVAQAVDYASFENLKKREVDGTFRQAGKKMQPGRGGNPDSYKVRRGKVGGYRDYFDDDQVREINAYIRTHLDPAFGYETV